MSINSVPNLEVMHKFCLALERTEIMLLVLIRLSTLVHVAQLIASCQYLLGHVLRNGIDKAPKSSGSLVFKQEATFLELLLRPFDVCW